MRFLRIDYKKPANNLQVIDWDGEAMSVVEDHSCLVPFGMMAPCNLEPVKSA